MKSRPFSNFFPVLENKVKKRCLTIFARLASKSLPDRFLGVPGDLWGPPGVHFETIFGHFFAFFLESAKVHETPSLPYYSKVSEVLKSTQNGSGNDAGSVCAKSRPKTGARKRVFSPFGRFRAQTSN